MFYINFSLFRPTCVRENSLALDQKWRNSYCENKSPKYILSKNYYGTFHVFNDLSV